MRHSSTGVDFGDHRLPSVPRVLKVSAIVIVLGVEMRRFILPAIAAANLLAGGASGAATTDVSIRINQIQVIGTHNSYHAGLTPGVAKLMQAVNPQSFAGLDYSHANLTAQLDHGVRQVELDIFADAKGGLFAHPFGATLNTGGAAAFDPAGVMQKPGFKVMHIQDIDYVSNCQPFVACLREIRTWSLAHPRITCRSSSWWRRRPSRRSRPCRTWRRRNPSPQPRSTPSTPRFPRSSPRRRWSPRIRCAGPTPPCPKRSPTAAGPR